VKEPRRRPSRLAATLSVTLRRKERGEAGGGLGGTQADASGWCLSHRCASVHPTDQGSCRQAR
jgi:hypothetical protein